MSLKSYVEQKNGWNAIFGKAPYDLSSAADRQKIADSIDCDLSPENLTCDGELPRSEVNRRYNQLAKAAEELKALDPTVTFWEF